MASINSSNDKYVQHLVTPHHKKNSFKTRIKGIAKYWLLAPTLLLLIIFFAIPYVTMTGMSFFHTDPSGNTVFTLENYANVFQDGYYWGILVETFFIAISATVISLILGYQVAYHLSRVNSRYKTFFLFLVIAPLMVGIVIRSFGWISLLQYNGLINQLLIGIGIINEPIQFMYNSFGVLIALVHIFMPFMILPIYSNLQSINPDLALAARSLGVSRAKVFLTITWPLSLPGVISGTVLVFLMSLSSYAIPILLGKYEVMMSSIVIVQMIMNAQNWSLGSAMAVVFFIVAVIILLIYNRIMGSFVKGLNAK